MVTTSLNKLVFELLEQRRAQLKNTDSLDRRLVIDWIETQRSRLLRESFKKPFRGIDDNLVQDLGADIELEQVSSNELSIVDYKYLLRTKEEIPVAIDRYGGIGTYTRIGPPDKSLPAYQVIPYSRSHFSGNGHFDRNAIYAFRMGDYIYLTSKSGYHLSQQYIHIRGVFQDAIAAAKFTDSTWTYDDNYPINKSMVDMLKTLIVKEKFQLTLIQPEDKIDDQEDKITPEGRTRKQQ